MIETHCNNNNTIHVPLPVCKCLFLTGYHVSIVRWRTAETGFFQSLYYIILLQSFRVGTHGAQRMYTGLLSSIILLSAPRAVVCPLTPTLNFCVYIAFLPFVFGLMGLRGDRFHFGPLRRTARRGYAIV